jgi:hypothetical protein
MCEWRRIQTKRKRKLKSFPGAQGVKMMSRLEPLRFLEAGSRERERTDNRRRGSFSVATHSAKQMIGADFTAESAFGTLDKQWVPMTINYRQLVITKNNRLEFSDYSWHFFRPRCCKIEVSRAITSKKAPEKISKRGSQARPVCRLPETHRPPPVTV